MGGVGSGARPKVYPAEMVETVRRLYYDEGQTQVEVAEVLEVTQRVIFKLMRNHGMKTRPQAKRNQLGARNTQWRGDSAGYQACHARVVSKRGKASGWLCAMECGRRAQDWANLTGNYPDPDDFAAMCRSCHRKFDRRMAKLEKDRVMPDV